jgi:hypothetical protein
MTTTTNKHTAIRKTDTGKTIEVTIERGTWDENINLDGWDTGTVKTHLVNRTTIILRDVTGKVLTSGDEISMVTPTAYHKNYKDLIAKGAIARIGDAFVGQATVDIINSAIAESDAATPKTARQIEIETAEAKRKTEQDAWKNSPEGKADAKAMRRHEQLVREMDRPDSDY